MPLNAVARRAARRRPAPDKRDAILRAAIDVFAERGFFNAQVADVARAAGVAAGTVYLYFKRQGRSARLDFRAEHARRADQGPRRRRRPARSARAAAAPRARPPRAPRPRPQPGDRLPGRAAAVDQVHGALFRDAAARLPRPDPRGDRRRPARRAASAPTSRRRSPPRCCSARSTRWPPTGFSAAAATRSRPTPTRSSISSSTARGRGDGPDAAIGGGSRRRHDGRADRGAFRERRRAGRCCSISRRTWRATASSARAR